MAATPMPALPLTWQAGWFKTLRHIGRLDFDARSGPASRMQWNHAGHGRVAVTVDGQDIHFDEHFALDNGLPCSDRKCWRFTDQGIVFRHWRQQQFQDILLLVPAEAGRKGNRHSALPPLVARSPYSCPPDLYDGTLMQQANTLLLSLRITGTRKDEHIQYRYQHSGHQTGLDGPSQ